MKTVLENGTKKYLVKFTGKPNWLPTTKIFQERFIENNTYKVFKMKNGFQIIIEGLFESETGKKQFGSRTYLTQQSKFLQENFKYC